MRRISKDESYLSLFVLRQQTVFPCWAAARNDIERGEKKTLSLEDFMIRFEQLMSFKHFLHSLISSSEINLVEDLASVSQYGEEPAAKNS